MQVLTRLMTVVPGGRLSPRRSWLRLRHRMSSTLRQSLSALLRHLAALLFGPQRDRAEGPAFVEVDPKEETGDGSWCEAPAVHPAEVSRLLERIRDNGRQDDLAQILGALGRLLPLLRGADVPAHKLQGLELSMRQMGEAARSGSSGGFELNMAWLLLEREVAAVGASLE